MKIIDTANKEAAAIFVDALKSLEAAKTADQAYVEKAKGDCEQLPLEEVIFNLEMNSNYYKLATL